MEKGGRTGEVVVFEGEQSSSAPVKNAKRGSGGPRFRQVGGMPWGGKRRPSLLAPYP